jgi:hypothetical protein
MRRLRVDGVNSPKRETAIPISNHSPKAGNLIMKKQRQIATCPSFPTAPPHITWLQPYKQAA